MITLLNLIGQLFIFTIMFHEFGHYIYWSNKGYKVKFKFIGINPCVHVKGNVLNKHIVWGSLAGILLGFIPIFIYAFVLHPVLIAIWSVGYILFACKSDFKQIQEALINDKKNNTL